MATCGLYSDKKKKKNPPRLEIAVRRGVGRYAKTSALQTVRLSPRGLRLDASTSERLLRFSLTVYRLLWFSARRVCAVRETSDRNGLFATKIRTYAGEYRVLRTDLLFSDRSPKKNVYTHNLKKETKQTIRL